MSAVYRRPLCRHYPHLMHKSRHFLTIQLTYRPRNGSTMTINTMLTHRHPPAMTVRTLDVEPRTPRCSLPGLQGSSWTLSAGDQLFIAGNGARYGNAQNVERAVMPGTATDPIWIVGVGERHPELNFERFSWQQGRHVIFDSVHFRSPLDNFRMRWSDATGPIEYFTFRSVDCSGSEGTHSNASRRCCSLGGSSNNILQFVVFHDIDIWGLGRWQR